MDRRSFLTATAGAVAACGVGGGTVRGEWIKPTGPLSDLRFTLLRRSDEAKLAGMCLHKDQAVAGKLISFRSYGPEGKDRGRIVTVEVLYASGLIPKPRSDCSVAIANWPRQAEMVAAWKRSLLPAEPLMSFRERPKETSNCCWCTIKERPDLMPAHIDQALPGKRLFVNWLTGRFEFEVVAAAPPHLYYRESWKYLTGEDFVG
jgi:hypothetical protein